MLKLKVGYWPLSGSLDSPGDRRRLVFWARSRGHEIITDLSQKVDVVVASENSDFKSRVFRETKAPIIFDLVDAYLCPKNPIDDLVRGIAKRVDKQLSSGLSTYTRYVKDFCQLSKLVICSSPEQEQIAQKFNVNTHIILDCHSEIPFRDLTAITKSPKLHTNKILWEGQPATLGGIKKIRSALKKIVSINDLELEFITDKKYFKLLNKYISANTLDLLADSLKLGENKVSVTSWSPKNLLEVAQTTTFAIIPTDLSNPIVKFKPENRLLIMWRLGLPCLTSASPAYERVSSNAGVGAVCKDSNEWLRKMQILINDPDFARDEALKGQAYLRDHHTESQILKKWDAAIESALSC
jgi:hypothetical protein